MNLKFDFVIHWLWTIVYAVLILSGLSMVGAKYGWITNYHIATADYFHRVGAMLFVILTFISIVYEIIRVITNNQQKMAWFIFGKSGYAFFTFITALIFVITGMMIWICMDSNMAVTSLALFVHEKLTYIVTASIIWHIYQKSHALLWPKKPEKAKQKPTGGTVK